MFNSRIYLDYASLTPIDPRIIDEVKRFSHPRYANSSSWYKEGVVSKNALDIARRKIADSIHAHPDEIIFTSGGTESNNLAIIGAVESLREKGVDYDKMHVLVSAIEHSSVRECANYLNGKGVIVDSISVGKDGVVSLDEIRNKIKINTVIVSVMTVNNEIGTIQPIREITKIIRKARKDNVDNNVNILKLNSSNQVSRFNPFDFQDFNYPIFHTDASQAFLYEELNVEQLGVDLLTLDSAKVYGPHGIGNLFIRRGVPVSPVIHGGGQEFGMRSGTENLPAIMGFAKALEIANKDRAKEVIRISKLKDYFYKGLKKINKDIQVNPMISNDPAYLSQNIDIKIKNTTKESGTLKLQQSPHILNVFIPKIDGEFFVMQLDANGIACSTKSSCLRDEDESYVLKSIGVNSKNSIRFSFGRWTKKRHINKALKVIRSVLSKSV